MRWAIYVRLTNEVVKIATVTDAREADDLVALLKSFGRRVVVEQVYR